MKTRIASSIHSRGKLLLVAICVSVGVGAFAVQALGSFGKAKNFAAGAGPSAVAIGNFNGDTRRDLVVANNSSGNVSILLSKGSGSFGKAKNFASGVRPVGVVVGNFNGDANPDLAVANGGEYRDDVGGVVGYNVSILLGNGDGTFGLATSFSTGPTGRWSPRALAVGNLNGDTVPDIVVSCGEGISVLIGNGDGTFGPPITTDVGGNAPQGIAVGDFNGDTNTDVVYGTYAGSNYVVVRLGNGDGTFRGGNEFPAGQTPRSVAVGNLNRDLFPDIAAANIRSNSVSILLGRRDGTFGGFVPYPASKKPTPSPSSVAIGNLNGDGLADLAVTNGETKNVAVLLGNGNGTFAALRSYPVGTGPAAVAIGNLNAGSDPDLAVANRGSANVSVLLNAGSSPRNLTLFYRPSKHRFTGRLTSADPACVRSQRVRVMLRRSGPDRQVGTELSASNGTYRIGENAKPGAYYARVRAWSACRAERSKTITVHQQL